MKNRILWLFLTCIMVLTLVAWSCGGTKIVEGEQEEEEEEEEEEGEQEEEEYGEEEEEEEPLPYSIIYDGEWESNEESGGLISYQRLYLQQFLRA